MFKGEKFKFNYKKNQNFFVRNLGILLSVLVIFGIFFVGVYVGKKTELAKVKQETIKELVNKDSEPDFLVTEEIDFGLLWKVWDKIKKDYASDDINEVDMFYGALQGIVASLKDPYSVFLVPQVAEEFQEGLDGKFEGIGAEIGIKNEQLTIVTPLIDSPAESAGLKAGDKILAIDDYDTNGISLDQAVKRIRGDKGTAVRLLVSRKDQENKEYQVIRDKIVIKSVQWRVEDDVAYLRILQFGTDTIKEFDEAVKKIVLKNPKGVILDLRSNPGGYLTGAIKMAGEWIPDDIVVYERHNGVDQGFKAFGKGRLKGLKTVVLINGGSASGSEIVAGALQDYGLATLIGETSFGKGSVQDYEEYSDGSALKLTIALWLTPNKNSINGEGIIPDMEVIPTEEDYKSGNDIQLDQAKEFLK